MQLKPERIQLRLDATGKSAREVSMRVAGQPDLLRHILAGRQLNTSGPKLLRLAAELESSIDYLYANTNEVGEPPIVEPRDDGEKPRPRSPPRSPPRIALATNGAPLPVRHVVQAGAWLEVDEGAVQRIVSPPVVADPKFPRDAQWLELVRGDSVDLFFPEGAFVHVVDAVAIGYAPQDGHFVVVERRREQGGLIERSLKQVEKRGKRVELWPRSRNPKWTAPLDLKDAADADTVVEIAALVLGGYLPAMRAL